MKKFSLIELLVVIAIIGILASMLLPALGKVRSTALTTDCVSEMKQIAIGAEMYMDDNKQVFNQAHWSQSKFWDDGIVKLAASQAASSPFHFQVPISGYYMQGNTNAFQCSMTNEDAQNSFKGDHSFNTLIQKPAGDYPDFRVSDASSPNELLFMTDTNAGWLNEEASRVQVRHEGGKLNHLWADGHVTTLKWSVFFNNMQWLRPNNDGSSVSFSGSFIFQ